MNLKNRSKFLLNQFQSRKQKYANVYVKKNNVKTFNVKTYSQLCNKNNNNLLLLVFKLCALCIYIKNANFTWIQFDFLNRLKVLRDLWSVVDVR